MLQNIANEVHHGDRTELILPWIPSISLAVIVGIAYFFAAQLSLALLAESDGVALFWPAAGVSSGVLIALGRGARLPVVCGVIVATIVSNLMGDRSVWNAVASAIWNAGEAVFAAWLVERYFGPGFTLERLRNVLGLLAAAVAATAVSGIGGMASFKLFHNPAAPMWITWQHWFVSDSVGIIIVAPLMIGLAKAVREPPRRNEIFEGVVALVALAATIIVVIFVLPDPAQTVRPAALLLPILLWLTARCQPVFAAAAAFVVSLTVICTITFSIGHFGDPRVPILDRILDAQATIVAFALYSYVLAALFAERRQHEVELEESGARLQEALTAGAVTAFEWDPRDGLIRGSENAAQTLGFDSRKPFTAAQFLEHVHPDDRAGYQACVDGVSVDNPAYSATYRFIRPDGQEVWLETTAGAEFDPTGRLIRLKGLTRDITRRQQSEIRQDLLLAELDHRVKNVLARVASIVVQTRQGCRTVDEFVRALHGRIQSMAAAHALLSRSRWSDVDLTDVIRRQLAPYTADANTAIGGPEITLTSAQAQAVALVIHELVTNAAKHGALSCSDGRVSVSWECAGVDAATILTITWREIGGPPIKAPVRFGYGSSLIRNLIPYELGGTVDLTFPSDGACCKIEIAVGEGAKTSREDALRSATMHSDGAGTGVHEFFKTLRLTAQRELERAARDADAIPGLTATTLPIKAVVTVGAIDLKFEVDGEIALA